MEKHSPCNLQTTPSTTASWVDSSNSCGSMEEMKACVANDKLSPTGTMQENGLATKTPNLITVELLKQMPFRERNSEEGKKMLPPHITVPPKKLFGYPERYRSPTDAMVSPVSRGLLTRNRRPARTLAPVVPPKALENTFQEVVVEVVAGNETN